VNTIRLCANSLKLSAVSNENEGKEGHVYAKTRDKQYLPRIL